MKINKKNIPKTLIEVLNDKSILTLNNKINILIPFLKEPMIFLESQEQIKTVHENSKDLLKEPIFAIKEGSSFETISLPFLDYNKCIFIAINKYPGDDLAIALDYRENNKEPRIIASDFTGNYTYCEWRVVFNNFNDFYQKLMLTPPASARMIAR